MRLSTQRAQKLPVDLIPLESTIEFVGASESDQDKLVEGILSFRLSALITMYLRDQTLLRVLDTRLPIIQLTEMELKHPNLVSLNRLDLMLGLIFEYFLYQIPN